MQNLTLVEIVKLSLGLSSCMAYCFSVRLGVCLFVRPKCVFEKMKLFSDISTEFVFYAS